MSATKQAAGDMKSDLAYVRGVVSSMVRSRIVGTAEFRLPGNGRIGTQVKLTTGSYLGRGPMSLARADESDVSGPGVQDVVDYFSELLRRRIKGNFIVETLPGGKIAERITNETLTGIESPVVLGNNVIATTKKGD